MRAQFVASEMLIGVRRNITMILSVVLAVAVSLFLVGFALLVRNEVDRAKGYWYDKVQVSVFLCGAATSRRPSCPHAATDGADQPAIHNTLRRCRQVDKVCSSRPQQAAARAQGAVQGQPELLAAATRRDLPESCGVKLKDPSKTDVVVSAVAAMPGVDEAFDQRQGVPEAVRR